MRERLAANSSISPWCSPINFVQLSRRLRQKQSLFLYGIVLLSRGIVEQRWLLCQLKEIKNLIIFQISKLLPLTLSLIIKLSSSPLRHETHSWNDKYFWGRIHFLIFTARKLANERKLNTKEENLTIICDLKFLSSNVNVKLCKRRKETRNPRTIELDVEMLWTLFTPPTA